MSKPLDECAPGFRKSMKRMHGRKKGNSLLRDGDFVVDECPSCLVQLRVRRGGRGPIMLCCPCGYEVEAKELTQ